MRRTIVIDKNEFARTAADYFIAQAQAALRENKQFAVALSGGSTPRSMYRLLADAQLNWKNIHLFWSDERCVPPDHPESNYFQAFETLISHINIPPQNIHRIFGEISPELAAAQYEQELRSFFGERPRFDLILLGLGEDGHTASLFPSSPALDERDHWAVAVPHVVPPAPLVSRVTLTLPILNMARQVVFLVSGSGKAARVAEILNAPTASPLLPANMVQPDDGVILWLMDQSAAAEMVK